MRKSMVFSLISVFHRHSLMKQVVALVIVFDDRLDMRMDQSQALNAYEVVNTYSEDDLKRIFYEYGEEKYASSVAKNIIKYRKINPIKTTFELVDIIKDLPNKELRKKGHPAKQVFQLIGVNDTVP